jgi:hypothetical protein
VGVRTSPIRVRPKAPRTSRTLGPSAQIPGWLRVKRSRPDLYACLEMSGRGSKTYGSARRSELTAMRTGLVCLTLALLAVALAVPAIAEAYRAATPAEQSEMERSAVLYHENPNSDVPGTNVTVTNVKVSTAGPWALASVAVTAKATGEQAGGPEAFRQIDGTWTDVGFFNEEPASMLPEAVAKDLGVPYLPSNESGTSTSTARRAPNPTKGGGGLSTLAIIGIVVGGLILLSAIGGRSGRKSGWTSGNSVPTAAFPGSQPAGNQVECPNCRGRKWENCRLCGGAGCWGCRGGRVTCQTCKGTGTAPARA